MLGSYLGGDCVQSKRQNFIWAVCRYGTDCMKPTSLLCTAHEFGPLGRECCCTREHVRLEGSRTTEAAEYPQDLCSEVAKVALSVAAAQKSRRTPPEAESMASPNDLLTSSLGPATSMSLSAMFSRHCCKWHLRTVGS